MDIKVIKDYLIDFQEKEFPELIERDLGINLKSQKIISLIGPRRAGKTFYFYQLMKQLLKNGVNKKQILYLNFENPKLLEINFKDIHEIIKIHWSIYPEIINEQLFVFFDEPQNIDMWENAVRALHDERNIKIFITGSSSKLLSKEIATSLRGRTITYFLLPFSFIEFLRMKKRVFNIKQLSSKELSYLKFLFNEYLMYGGFPEVVIENDKNTKIKILKEYFDVVIYRDIIERHTIKNTQLIKWLIKSLIAGYTKQFSVNKLYNTIKSQGRKVSKNSLYLYIDLIENSMFAYFINKFDYSIRKRSGIPKIYLNDVGYARLIETSPDFGKKMENLVFLELLRQKNINPLLEIYYWYNIGGEEVDFVIKEDKVKQLIQICYNLSDIDTKKREIKALLKASKELKCKDLLVITEDYETEEKIGNKKIKFIPLWKWILK